jgi:tetratricopeptide (TPR) repeat protein
MGPETDEPLYQQGQQLEKQGRPQEALNSFLKLIAKRGEQAPEAHLEAGIIELEEMKNPLEAIHHFRMYLQLEPNSRLAPQVRDQVQRAQREFAATLPAPNWETGGGTPELQTRITGLQNQVLQLQAENNALRVQLGNPRLPSVPTEGPPANAVPPEPAAAQQLSFSTPQLVPVGPAPAEPAAAAPAGVRAQAGAAPTRPSGRTHVVQAHETLYKIAAEYLGSGKRYKEIIAANPDKFRGGNLALSPGEVLKLP